MNTRHHGCCKMSELFPSDIDNKAHKVVNVYFYHIQKTCCGGARFGQGGIIGIKDNIFFEFVGR
jgi:hypothetical protein